MNPLLLRLEPASLIPHILPGDVVQINVTGQPVVILGSLRAANELLDSRGTVSDNVTAHLASSRSP